MGLNSLESSANKAIVELYLIKLGTSLTYKTNNNGPSIEPCGIPDVTGSKSENVPSRATLWYLSVR
jgi:hypothetical protein